MIKNRPTDFKSPLPHDDEFIKKHYGQDAIIVRLGYINIIHLDHPSEQTIRERTEEIMREELNDETFFDDCPLCQEMKEHPYDIVYYDKNSEEE